MATNGSFTLWPYSLPVSNRIKVLGMVGACCAASTVLFLFNPVSAGFYPPCLVKLLTGFYCPGCGTARALHQLLHGDFLKALDFNPLLVISLPFLAYGFLSYVLSGLGQRGFPRIFTSSFWTWAIYSTMFVYTLLRNIPIYPLTVLAP